MSRLTRLFGVGAAIVGLLAGVSCGGCVGGRNTKTGPEQKEQKKAIIDPVGGLAARFNIDNNDTHGRPDEMRSDYFDKKVTFYATWESARDYQKVEEVRYRVLSDFDGTTKLTVTLKKNGQGKFAFWVSDVSGSGSIPGTLSSCAYEGTQNRCTENGIPSTIGGKLEELMSPGGGGVPGKKMFVRKNGSWYEAKEVCLEPAGALAKCS